MKQVILVLVILTAAANAPAEVAITCVADDNEVTVSYDASTEPTLVRIFTLDVTVDNGAKIVSMPLESFNPDYWVYPASVSVNPTTGQVDNYGSPIADRTMYEAGSDAYNGTEPGLGTSGVTVEMGSLYKRDVDSPPAAAGVLFRFTVDKGCNVTIAQNQVREGVVIEGAVPPSAFNSPGCTVASAGCPTCAGDMNGDGWLSPTDISNLISTVLPYRTSYYWVISPAGSCGDINGDGWLSPADISSVVSILLPYETAYYWKVCD